VRGQADQLGRASHNVFVRTRTPGSALYASTDDGRTWANRANPCAAPRGVATPPAISDLVVGADGSVTLLCRSSRSTFLITSTDGGATFGPPVPDSQFPPGTAALGAADASTLFFVADSLYRSGDGGRTWQRVATDSTTGSGTPNFIGFEDSTTGRWVTGDGSTVWTTTDSGKTWRAHAFR
jgi:photosystem II stability/assembly factor-like uncharacterized protein